MDTRKQVREHFIKAGMPTVDKAMLTAKYDVMRSKQNHDGCVVFIHGYGSHGNGGAICIEFRKWINSQLSKGKVKCVINGEDFSIFNFKALELKNKYKGLDGLMDRYNHGVTIVEL